MYQQFFGFKERPFKLVPDPEYLFLSRSHEEALAHLRYAVISGDGFVELIGEVGTGKTLICRVFLETMAEGVETAYIFNPRMSARQLLSAINAEFGIPSDHETISELIDELNRFLIRQKARGRKAILLIDEAQNLSRSVLEQIRLLTNLETTKQKLLQIVLSGQPELEELMDSMELRQLAQRITLSCRLRPLTLRETEAYIRHRVRVAACRPVPVFSRSAIRVIHSFSKGIPRLVNISCDRALLAAYADKKRRVTARTAGTAVSEISGRAERRRPGVRRLSLRRAVYAVFGAACLAAAVILYQGGFPGVLEPLFHRSGGVPADAGDPPPAGTPEADQKPAGPPENRSASRAESSLPGPLPKPAENEPAASAKTRKPRSLEKLLQIPEKGMTRRGAAAALLSRWVASPRSAGEFESISDDDDYFELFSRLNGLHIHRLDGDLDLVRKLGLPAILKMEPPGGKAPVYLLVSGTGEKSLRLQGADSDSALQASYAKIRSYWSGVAYVVWRDFYHYRGTIPLDAPPEAIITLKMHLREIGFGEIEVNADYDALTRQAVRTVQARHGIPVDGYVGPLTKIILYNEQDGLRIPRLEKNGSEKPQPASRPAAAAGGPDPGAEPEV
jgi:general secretion pathway protein A